MKIACLYLTNISSYNIFNLQILFHHITSYKHHEIDLYIYSNNENLNDIIYNDKYCEFSYQTIGRKYNYVHHFDKDKNFIGNCQLPLIDIKYKILN